jgi:hypothetical protein
MALLHLCGPWPGKLTRPPTGALQQGGAAQGALVAPQPCWSAAQARAVQGEPAGAIESAKNAPAISPTPTHVKIGLLGAEMLRGGRHNLRLCLGGRRDPRRH